MHLSRYLSTYSRNGIVAIFHSLHPEPAYIEEKRWQEFLENASTEQPDWIVTLQGLGLLMNEKDIDEETRQQTIAESSLSRTMSILYLVLTKGCNFCCRQCFQPERKGLIKPDNSMMTVQTAEAAVDQFIRHIEISENLPIEPQIQFYGGEPLMNWKTLRAAVIYAKAKIAEGSLPDDTKMSVVTNGSLLDEAKAEFLAEQGVGVGLSIDGPRELNDDYRKMVGKQVSTYDLAQKAAQVLTDAGIQFSLSITITPKMVHDLPAAIRWAHDEMKVKDVSFNLIGDSSLERLGEITRDKYAQTAAEQMVFAHILAREWSMSEDRMERKMRDFADRLFKYVDCGALGNQLVVNPHGEIAFCHADSAYEVGHVDDSSFNMFGKMQDHEWRKALPIYMEDCQSCPALSICGYGCFHHATNRGLPVTAMDDVHCAHTKKAMEYLIWALYDKTTSI